MVAAFLQLREREKKILVPLGRQTKEIREGKYLIFSSK